MRDYFKKVLALCDHIPMDEKAIIPSQYPLQAGRSLFKEDVVLNTEVIPQTYGIIPMDWEVKSVEIVVSRP